MENNVAWLRQQTRDLVSDRNSVRDTETALHLSKSSEWPRMPTDASINNIDHAADVIWRLIERATAVEARLRSLAEGAVENLRLADNRIQSLEAERQAAETRLREAEEVLKQAQLRIAHAEDQLAQAQLRAKSAETHATELQKILLRVEYMENLIGTRLRQQERDVFSNVALAA